MRISRKRAGEADFTSLFGVIGEIVGRGADMRGKEDLGESKDKPGDRQQTKSPFAATLSLLLATIHPWLQSRIGAILGRNG